LKLAATTVWAAGDNPLALGEVTLDQPGALLLEGLGRALQVFEPIERGLDAAAPEAMQLTPAEAFVLVRTAATRLRDVGVGVVLPASLSGGLASRLGLAMEAELPERSRGFTLGESLNWSWQFRPCVKVLLMWWHLTIGLLNLGKLPMNLFKLRTHRPFKPGCKLNFKPL
jgi:hypothetical protein